MKYEEIEEGDVEAPGRIHDESNLPEQELDFDYTETQLEEFLQSCKCEADI